MPDYVNIALFYDINGLGMTLKIVSSVSQANKAAATTTNIDEAMATTSPNKFLYNIQRKCQAEGPKTSRQTRGVGESWARAFLQESVVQM